MYMRNFLWTKLFKNAMFTDSSRLIPYSIIAVFVVFITCSLIELIRINVFEVQYMKLIDHLLLFKETRNPNQKKTVLIDRLVNTQENK